MRHSRHREINVREADKDCKRCRDQRRQNFDEEKKNPNPEEPI
jgi:hypothetical protein